MKPIFLAFISGFLASATISAAEPISGRAHGAPPIDTPFGKPHTWQGEAVIIWDNGECGGSTVGWYSRSSFTPSFGHSGNKSYISFIFAAGGSRISPTSEGYWKKSGKFTGSGISTNGWVYEFNGKYSKFKTVPSDITRKTKTFVMFIDIANYDGKGAACVVRKRIVYGKRP